MARSLAEHIRMSVSGNGKLGREGGGRKHAAGVGAILGF